MEKGLALHLNKIEFPLPKNTLYQVWLILVLWFWRRRFLNIVNVLSLICNYLPWKGVWSLTSPPHMLCAKYDWNWPSGSGEEDENMESLQTDGCTTDNRPSEKLTWTFSSSKLKTMQIRVKIQVCSKQEPYINTWTPGAVYIST